MLYKYIAYILTRINKKEEEISVAYIFDPVEISCCLDFVDPLLQEEQETLDKLVFVQVVFEPRQGAVVVRRAAIGRILDHLADVQQLLRHLRSLLRQVHRVAEERAEAGVGEALPFWAHPVRARNLDGGGAVCVGV